MLSLHDALPIVTDWAKAELKRLNDAGIPDRIFPMFRCWGDIRCVDPAIDPSDRKPNWCYRGDPAVRSEEHTSELQSLMRISYAVFCLKNTIQHNSSSTQPDPHRPYPHHN